MAVCRGTWTGEDVKVLCCNAMTVDMDANFAACLCIAKTMVDEYMKDAVYLFSAIVVYLFSAKTMVDEYMKDAVYRYSAMTMDEDVKASLYKEINDGVISSTPLDCLVGSENTRWWNVPRLGELLKAIIQMHMDHVYSLCSKIHISGQIRTPRLSEYFNFRAFKGNMKQVLAGFISSDCVPNPAAAENSDTTSMHTRHQATWHVASAAVNHMTGNLNILTGYKPTSGDRIVHVPHMGPMKVQGSGLVNTLNVALLDVWYVPGLEMNLVSAGQLTKLGCKVSFGSDGCRISKGGDDNVIGKALFTEEFQFEVEFIKVPPSAK